MATGAKKGMKKMRKPMTRKTKIRKRVFGVTSLILAVLVAALPTTSRAALTGNVSGPFHLSMEGSWSTDDVVFEIDSESKNPNDGGTAVERYMRVTKVDSTDTIYNDLRIRLENDLPHGTNGSDHTGRQVYKIEYFKDAAFSSGSEFTDSDWKGATLELGISKLENLLDFEDFYWTNSLQTLRDQYGAQMRVYAYRDYGASHPKTGWYEADGYQSHEGSAGYWGYVDMIAAGFRHDSNSDQYCVTHIAVVYRDQMEVDALNGTELEKTDRLMAAGFRAFDVKDQIIKFSNVETSTSTLRGSIQAKIGKTLADNEFYQFNMILVNSSLPDNCINGGSNTYAVSIPLPSYMNATGNHTTGNYSVFRSVKNTQSVDSVIPINQFDVVDRDGVMTLQFTVTYDDSVDTYDLSGEPAYPNDFGVVYNGSVPLTGDPKIAAYPASSGGGSATMTVGGSIKTNNSTVPVNTEVTFTAAPSNSNYTFNRWSSNKNGSDTISTNNPYKKSIVADTTLYAVFDYSGGGGGITPPGTYQLTVATNPAGGGTTSRSSGPTQGGAFTITATPAEHFYFGKWEWDLGNDGKDSDYFSPEMTETLTADSTATAYFYQLKYFDDRSEALSNYSTDPYRATLTGGRLLGNAELHVKGPTVDGPTVLVPLTEKRYGSGTTLYRSYDYFSLSLTPDSSIVSSPYTITISKMALPAYMDTSTETGGAVDLWYHDPTPTAESPTGVMRSIGDDKLTVHTDGTISFTIDETTSMGNYVLVWSKEPAWTVQDKRDNPVPAKSATAAEPKDLPANRTLVIKDYNDADAIYKEAEDGFTDTNGKDVEVTAADAWAIVNSELVGLIDEKNPGLGSETKTDISKIETITIPYDLGFMSNSGKVYQITGAPGAYVYKELASSEYGIQAGTLIIKNATPSKYNADYVVLINRTMEFRVRDQRLDKPAQPSSSAYEATPEASTTQSLMPEDRYVIIENINPEGSATITTAIHNTEGYEDWTVIPYEIRYVDGAGVDKDDYTPIPIRLTIPDRAKGKYKLLLASLDENGATPILYLPETVKEWGSNDEYVDFTATHFSPYALLYQQEAPVVDNSVKVTQGASTPASGGGYGGAGTYQKGDQVTLTAYPAAGYEISYWTAVDKDGNQTRLYPSATDTNGNKTTAFQITRDLTVSAVFDALYTVRALADPATGNTVTVMDGPTFQPGNTVVIQADKAPVYWEDNGQRVQNGGTIYQIPAIDGNHTVIAHFTGSTGGTGDTGGTGGTGGVNVTSSTTDGGTASASPNADGTWKLTAVAAPGYQFDHWEGPNGKTSKDNPLTITPSGTESWKAVFTSTGSSGGTNTSGGNVTVTQDTQGGTGTGSTTGGTTGGTGVSSQGKNANDMPKTGLFDQFGTYKMLAIILLVLFGAIELLGTVNTKKQRVPVQNGSDC